MAKNLPWILGFLALYGVHAFFYLAYTGGVAAPLPESIARSGALVTLVSLTLLVVAFVATRDEVLRLIALRAGAISAVATALFSYGISAFDIAAPFVTSNLWAFAILIFLFVYGVLSWLIRS